MNVKRLPSKKSKTPEVPQSRLEKDFYLIKYTLLLFMLSYKTLTFYSVFLLFSSNYLHFKLVCGWGVVVLLDAVVGFRLEYLYPAIMFLRSVLDSYKYQGLV